MNPLLQANIKVDQRGNLSIISASLTVRSPCSCLARYLNRSSTDFDALDNDKADTTALMRLMFQVCLDGILPCPLSSCSFVSRAISLVHVRNLGHQRVVWVWVCEHGTD